MFEYEKQTCISSMSSPIWVIFLILPPCWKYPVVFCTLRPYSDWNLWLRLFTLRYSIKDLLWNFPSFLKKKRIEEILELVSKNMIHGFRIIWCNSYIGPWFRSIKSKLRRVRSKVYATMEWNLNGHLSERTRESKRPVKKWNK